MPVTALSRMLTVDCVARMSLTGRIGCLSDCPQSLRIERQAAPRCHDEAFTLDAGDPVHLPQIVIGPVAFVDLREDQFRRPHEGDGERSFRPLVEFARPLRAATRVVELCPYARLRQMTAKRCGEACQNLAPPPVLENPTITSSVRPANRSASLPAIAGPAIDAMMKPSSIKFLQARFMIAAPLDRRPLDRQWPGTFRELTELGSAVRSSQYRDGDDPLPLVVRGGVARMRE